MPDIPDRVFDDYLTPDESRDLTDRYEDTAALGVEINEAIDKMSQLFRDTALQVSSWVPESGGLTSCLAALDQALSQAKTGLIGSGVRPILP